MSKQIKHLLYALPLLMAVGCDTTEEAFLVGSAPKEENFLNVDKALLSFTPEGGTQEIQITSIASWEITLSGNNHGQFSVSPMSGRGNATVQVTSKANPAANNYSAEIQLSPINFQMDPVKVTLNQANTTFSIDSYPSTDIMPEEGGSLSMTAYSSLDWKLEVIDIDGVYGDPEWLTITPSLEGEGRESNSPIEFRFLWSPNYTNEDRTIRFRMVPATDFELTEYPRPFTLTQQAGTLPQSVRVVVDNLDIVNANVTLDYSSRAPLKDCGIYMYKVDGNDEGTLLEKYHPTAQGGEYDKNGHYSFSLPELQEDMKFRMVPYAVNEIGEMTGSPVEFTTGIKPENMMYDGVAIVNGNDGVTVETSSNHENLKSTAKFSVVVTSDVEPLQNRIASAVLNVNGKNVPGAATSIDAGSWLYVFNVSDLVPNSTYDYSITITSADLPRSQGQMRAKTAVASGKFRTPGLTPGDTDNDKPTSGE